MHWADIIAGRRVSDAVRRGELTALPGEGAPLDLDVEPLVPPDVRALHRVLKHAGFTPPEVAELRALAALEIEWRGLDARGEAQSAKARALLQRMALLREARARRRTDAG